MTVVVRTHCVEDTERVGYTLAGQLSGGAVVAFRGGLGAGKTAFVRGLAAGLGYHGRVSSPTFAIVNEYEGGRLPLFHFDLYRLECADELDEIGWEDYLSRGGVCAVEWSERAEALLPPDAITVTLTAGEDDRERVIELELIQASSDRG